MTGDPRTCGQRDAVEGEGATLASAAARAERRLADPHPGCRYRGQPPRPLVEPAVERVLGHALSAEPARRRAAKPAFAVRAAKEALNAVHDGTQRGGLALERRAWSGLFGTHDQREGMRAFLEKREPEFE
jgi:enoyl-CoA hydratase/carnithine racemase